MKSKVAEVKKVEGGKLAVRWEGDKKFYVIPDNEIAQYLVYMLTREDKQDIVKNQNSRLR